MKKCFCQNLATYTEFAKTIFWHFVCFFYCLAKYFQHSLFCERPQINLSNFYQISQEKMLVSTLFLRKPRGREDLNLSCLWQFIQMEEYLEFRVCHCHISTYHEMPFKSGSLTSIFYLLTFNFKTNSPLISSLIDAIRVWIVIFLLWNLLKSCSVALRDWLRKSKGGYWYASF